MMTFNDIKAFIDFASDPKKYQAVVDQLDERQKKWEALVEVYTKVEDAAKYLEQVDAEANEIKAALLKEQEAFETQKTKTTEKLDAAKAKVAAAQEKVDTLKSELETQKELSDKYLAEARTEKEISQAYRITLEEKQAEVERLEQEYKDKLDKINSVLKQV